MIKGCPAVLLVHVRLCWPEVNPQAGNHPALKSQPFRHGGYTLTNSAGRASSQTCSLESCSERAQSPSSALTRVRRHSRGRQPITWIQVSVSTCSTWQSGDGGVGIRFPVPWRIELPGGPRSSDSWPICWGISVPIYLFYCLRHKDMEGTYITTICYHLLQKRFIWTGTGRADSTRTGE